MTEQKTEFGEWRLERAQFDFEGQPMFVGWVYGTESTAVVAHVQASWHVENGLSNDDAERYARLITAAPKLLAACDRALELLEPFADSSLSLGLGSEALDLLWQAVNEARGIERKAAPVEASNTGASQ